MVGRGGEGGSGSGSGNGEVELKVLRVEKSLCCAEDCDVWRRENTKGKSRRRSFSSCRLGL